jgi:hypothetical protein
MDAFATNQGLTHSRTCTTAIRIIGDWPANNAERLRAGGRCTPVTTAIDRQMHGAGPAVVWQPVLWFFGRLFGRVITVKHFLSSHKKLKIRQLVVTIVYCSMARCWVG